MMFGRKQQKSCNHYDLIFSIGSACCTSQALRSLGLQYSSFPFDWNGGSEISLATNVHALANDFKDWMCLDDWEIMPRDSNTPHHYLRNRRTHLWSAHDFPKSQTVAEGWAVVSTRYKRRTDRLLQLLRNSHRVLAVYVALPKAPSETDAEIVAAQAELAQHFPTAKVEVLYFRYAQEVPSEAKQVVQLSQDVTVVSMDYRYYGDGDAVDNVDYEMVATVIAEMGVRVRDYRTPAEKRAWRAASRKYRYDMFKARSWPDYLLTRISFKMCRFLAKRLSRKGVVLKLNKG